MHTKLKYNTENSEYSFYLFVTNISDNAYVHIKYSLRSILFRNYYEGDFEDIFTTFRLCYARSPLLGIELGSISDDKSHTIEIWVENIT